MVEKRKARQPVQIDGELVTRLREYSQATGSTITFVVETATKQWLDTTGERILKVAQSGGSARTK
jgi:hypothetical protein